MADEKELKPSSAELLRGARAKRAIRKLARMTLIIYVLLCIITYFAQDWLMFPAAKYQGMQDSIVKREKDDEVLHLTTSDGTAIAAIFAAALLPDGSPDPDAASRPTLLYFYGNGGAIAWSMNELDQFRRLDANVLIPDFAGFGMSGGKASERSLYATADAAYDYLLTRLGIDHTKIVPIGWSLGAAVAIDLASRKPVAGLATFNAFTTMTEMAHKTLPFLPTSLLLKYRFDNAAKIATISCPIFICNEMQDTLVSPEMSDRLAKIAKGRVTRLVIAEADHNTIFVANPTELFSALGKFVREIDSEHAGIGDTPTTRIIQSSEMKLN